MGCLTGGQKPDKSKANRLKLDKNGQNRGRPQIKKKTHQAKIVLVGAMAVGKSSIALRYYQNKFPDAHQITIAGAYFQKKIELQNQEQMKLHVWDTSGSQRFISMVQIYYRDAQAAILTYDITSEKSFLDLEMWKDQLSKSLDLSQIVLVLVANKCDLAESDRKVSMQRGRQYADNNGMLYFETSAKQGTGIHQLFGALSEAVYQRIK